MGVVQVQAPHPHVALGATDVVLHRGQLSSRVTVTRSMPTKISRPVKQITTWSRCVRHAARYEWNL